MPVPLIGVGISAAMGIRRAKQTGSVANTQKGLMGQQSALAQEMGRFGRNQISASEPALNKAMQYYATLAQGNRGAVNTLLAPQIGQLTDTYKGAERGLEANMMRGPARDRQMAELYRQKAGTLGMMPMAARSQAVGQMAGLGQNRLTAGMGMMGQAGNALSGAANTSQVWGNSQNSANDMWYGVGQNLMSTFMPYLQDWQKNKGTGMLPSRQTVPNVSFGMPGGG